MDTGKGAIKRPKIRKFQNAWLDENMFKEWLAPHYIENKAFCTICNKTIRCAKTDLVQHSQMVKHIEKVKSNNINDNFEHTLPHKDKVKRTELNLQYFLPPEHNVAFKTVDLIPLLKDICIDPKIVQDFSLGRLKCANIVKNVIAKCEVEKIANLQACKFSILIDESTDISDVKVMCILVRYVLPLNKKVLTQLLELIALDATNCSTNKLLEVFKNLLQEKKIPIKNIVGMASDNASVMIGCNNSFVQCLKLEPGLVILY